MSKLPAWYRAGFRRNGPGQLNCGACGKRVSSNALARAAHAKACTGSYEARKAKEQKR